MFRPIRRAHSSCEGIPLDHPSSKGGGGICFVFRLYSAPHLSRPLPKHDLMHIANLQPEGKLGGITGLPGSVLGSPVSTTPNVPNRVPSKRVLSAGVQQTP